MLYSVIPILNVCFTQLVNCMVIQNEGKLSAYVAKTKHKASKFIATVLRCFQILSNPFKAAAEMPKACFRRGNELLFSRACSSIYPHPPTKKGIYAVSIIVLNDQNVQSHWTLGEIYKGGKFT